MDTLQVRTAILFLQPPCDELAAWDWWFALPPQAPPPPPGLLARLRARLLGTRTEAPGKEPHGYENPPRASPAPDHAERTVETITAYASPRPDVARRSVQDLSATGDPTTPLQSNTTIVPSGSAA